MITWIFCWRWWWWWWWWKLRWWKSKRMGDLLRVAVGEETSGSNGGNDHNVARQVWNYTPIFLSWLVALEDDDEITIYLWSCRPIFTWILFKSLLPRSELEEDDNKGGITWSEGDVVQQNLNYLFTDILKPVGSSDWPNFNFNLKFQCHIIHYICTFNKISVIIPISPMSFCIKFCGN